MPVIYTTVIIKYWQLFQHLHIHNKATCCKCQVMYYFLLNEQELMYGSLIFDITQERYDLDELIINPQFVALGEACQRKCVKIYRSVSPFSRCQRRKPATGCRLSFFFSLFVGFHRSVAVRNRPVTVFFELRLQAVAVAEKLRAPV